MKKGKETTESLNRMFLNRESVRSTPPPGAPPAMNVVLLCNNFQPERNLKDRKYQENPTQTF